MKKYAKRLLDVRWQKKRLSILERDRWRCSWCGRGEQNLQIHHGYYGRDKHRAPWEYPDAALHTLCDTCHERAEVARAALYYEIGRIHPRHHFEIRRLLMELQELVGQDRRAAAQVSVVAERQE